jgi:predicted phage terminase large subunit-like protein
LRQPVTDTLSSQEIEAYLSKLQTLPLEDQREVLAALNALERSEQRADCQTHFMSFVRAVWPQFIGGYHHQIMADAFDRAVERKSKRIIINMPPRHTKSQFASYLPPAYYLGRHPDRFVIQASNTGDLAVEFGRNVRNLIDSQDYQSIFPGVELASDSKAAGKWNTNKRGAYFAVGVGGTVTGRGGDLIIIDDPHSEQEARQAEHNPEIFDSVYEWYTSGPRQRVQPDAVIVVVMTRWGKRDLTGRLLKAMIEGDAQADQWEIIELPALIDEHSDKERPIWPEFWSLKELQSTRSVLPVPKWQAQYQQKPTSEEGALVKREWWKRWEGKQPPPCEYIIQSWDTAYTKSERADFSACTTWGVFYREDEETGNTTANIILLDAWERRMEFPELKKRAKEEYDHWQPDTCIIEAKAAGAPLVYEMRQAGIPVSDYCPTRGNDKIARVNAVTDLFSSGVVWAPQHRWADEVIEEFAAFPAGEHDDYVDSGTQALLRFRQGGFIRMESDEWDETKPRRRRKAYY